MYYNNKEFHVYLSNLEIEITRYNESLK